MEEEEIQRQSSACYQCAPCLALALAVCLGQVRRRRVEEQGANPGSRDGARHSAAQRRLDAHAALTRGVAAQLEIESKM